MNRTSNAETSNAPTSWPANWLIVVVAIGLPSLVTWVYFIALAGTDQVVQQTAYGIGKAAQFLLPAVWVFVVRRERPAWVWPSGRFVMIGGLFGLAVALAMLALFFGVLRPAGWFEAATSAVRLKVQSFGAASPLAFMFLAVFYSVIHSLLEEYYWRWFVFGLLARRCPPLAALLASSFAFAAHHVLVLAHYFGAGSPLTWLFALAIVVGGACWAWLYRASGSLLAPWLSHALVDAAIFAIGYYLVMT